MTKRYICITELGNGSGQYAVGDMLEVDAERTANKPSYLPDASVYAVGVDVPILPAEFREIPFIPPVPLEEEGADAVNQPSHYTQGGVEVIDYIRQVTQCYDDGFVASCVGNAIKYVSRAPHKHETPLEDLKKARRYLDFAIAHLEGRDLHE